MSDKDGTNFCADVSKAEEREQGTRVRKLDLEIFFVTPVV